MKIQSLVLSALLIVVALGVQACQNKRRGADAASALRRVHFNLDQASIRPDMVDVLNGNASYLKKHSKLNVVLEGHCDERGTNEYNVALGDRRAQSVKSYLTTKGVADTRLRTMSFGEDRLLKQGHNESAWYMNRRVEFVRQ